ncbi:Holliday junction branch migration protein RuvA [Campylobacterota bacterium]|nr:Holliday junction branch migration protein RuvA [Campylobacterota bacterium]
MIIAIEGEIIGKEPSFCDLATAGGVAYRLFISLNTYAGLSNQTRARLLTSLVVREDSQTLYGFASGEERDLFEKLIKISGVGPKSAIAILSTFTPQQFVEAVATNNETLLTRVPGIGKKSAGLIIVQLGGSALQLGSGTKPADGYKLEAFLALESLGFKAQEITKAIEKSTAANTVDLIKEALKIIKK